MEVVAKLRKGDEIEIEASDGSESSQRNDTHHSDQWRSKEREMRWQTDGRRIVGLLAQKEEVREK